MELSFVTEYGPTYLAVPEKKQHIEFIEPTYFELDEKEHFTYIADKNKAYTIKEKYLIEVPKMFIGRPEQKAIILDENNKAVDYRRILHTHWKERIEIKYDNKSYLFHFDPVYEPEVIQLINNSLALLTIRKRQIVVLINKDGDILWQFGEDMIPGKGKQLKVPIFSLFLKDTKTILMCDGLNSRVLESDLSGEIIWQYGMEERLGASEGLLWKPTCARRTKEGETYIADSKNKRILVVNQKKEIINQYGQSLINELKLNYPRSVQEMPNGNWLITNTHKNSIIEVDPINMKVVYEINNIKDQLGLYWPRCAYYNKFNSEIIICDGLNNRILFVDYTSKKLKKVIHAYTEGSNEHPMSDPHHLDMPQNEHNKLLITLSESHEVVEIDYEGNLIRKWTGLNDPHSASYFPEGIVVSDSNNHHIKIYYDNGKEEVVDHFFTPEGEADSFNRPRFSVYYNDGLLVMDTANHRIVYVKKVETKWRGSLVDIKFPRNIRLNNLDNSRWINLLHNQSILLTDTENCRIMKLEIKS
ncbi:hypothetical protein AS034_16095 [[Bacillus] enclensis]|uniref:PQQ-like domain-containing protein n=1 Tax=[Bacillus] enclensis TaxID=1402860 RepID=A0A0V8HCV9_9BACI|nr:hypothetical protein [[Bacillus] enclensis]KSU60362.1 hypothetical protein AS034_16095 [[Bacillus] enclensis]SCC23655.1 hypothetical protein GA0061094_3329 [[Bacillus] enclensis]